MSKIEQFDEEIKCIAELQQNASEIDLEQIPEKEDASKMGRQSSLKTLNSWMKSIRMRSPRNNMNSSLSRMS